MKKTLLALSFVTILAGCAATGDDYVKGVVPEVTNHPTLGSVNSKERALLGPDADGNGVRDEIDRVAATQFSGAQVQASRYAVKFTEAMLSGAGGKARPAPAAADLASAAAALDSAAGPQASATLAARIANTPERRAAAAAAGAKVAAG